ncbi:MAG: 2-C-methyl-D-erythritol 4-phosphate cytidylyltransferase [Actinomycetota bacterium]|nr:2-C-methyl-D-erythritol 4-phosphate cytidylyltransferase [Actinomycetota bacterium]
MGTRLGPGQTKAIRPIGGVPLVVRALHALDAGREIDVGVLVAPAARCAEFQALLDAAGLTSRWSTLAGGETRSQSVACGLAMLPPDVDVVLVHDAARAFVPSAVVGRVVTAVEAGADAVVPVVPVADTVRQVDASGAVLRTLDRTGLRGVQTPQAFRRRVLDEAYAAHAAAGSAAEPATDDASLVERLGVRIAVVEGDALGFKITGPLDLLLAEALAAAESTR